MPRYELLNLTKSKGECAQNVIVQCMDFIGGEFVIIMLVRFTSYRKDLSLNDLLPRLKCKGC